MGSLRAGGKFSEGVINLWVFGIGVEGNGWPDIQVAQLLNYGAVEKSQFSNVGLEREKNVDFLQHMKKVRPLFSSEPKYFISFYSLIVLYTFGLAINFSFEPLRKVNASPLHPACINSPGTVSNFTNSLPKFSRLFGEKFSFQESAQSRIIMTPRVFRSDSGR